jgi:hypothetical protein
MIINNLEKMETIVKNNKALKWDGWSVVNYYPSEKARTSKYGALINGKWHMTRRFDPSEKGWDIPDKLVR